MILKEEVRQLHKNAKKDIRQIYEKVKQYPLITLFFLTTIFLLITLPYLQVDYRGINDATEEASLENQYRATLAQILGGVAIGIGLYYTWRRIAIAEKDLKATQENLKLTQENLKVSQEGQITERFTRAIDQLGNEKTEIRLGGIYALERIANESEKDYWPIMEILTAYVRKNSSINSQSKGNSLVRNPICMDIQANENTKTISEIKKLPFDIYAILTVIRRCKPPFNSEEGNYLDLHETNLWKAPLYCANLSEANLQKANLSEAILSEANLYRAQLEGTNLKKTFLHRSNLEGAFLIVADLEEADLSSTNLKWSLLTGAYLERADLSYTNLEGAFFLDANLKDADISKANLKGAFLMNANLFGANLSGTDFCNTFLGGADLRRTGVLADQLSEAQTLYDAKLDEELFIQLKENNPALFEKPSKYKPNYSYSVHGSQAVENCQPK